jgi:hypothetical protein
MSKGAATVKRRFGPAEVAVAIGVKRATLHSWMARRYIEIESQGAGVAREFSMGQVVYLGAIAAMTKRGIEISAALDILDPIKSDFMKAVRDDQGRGWVMLVEGDRAKIGKGEVLQKWLASWNDRTADSKRPVDAYILLLGPLVEQLRNALAYDGV